MNVRSFLACCALASLLTTQPAVSAGKGRPVGLVPNGHSILLIQANAVPGQETAFDEWYDGHMKDIIKLPGFIRGQRFKAQSRTGKPDPAYGYIILYEVNGSPDAIFAALSAAAKAGKLTIPDKRYVKETLSSTYRSVSPGIVH